MSRMAVIYWSMTGNTEAMANAIAEGAAGAGAEVDVKQVCDTTVDEALGYGLLALGCPAMGAEVLEEAEFEPFFTELEGLLGGKKVALFGSYDWGDGQWMRDWAQRADSAGANVYQDEGLILHLTPDEEAGVAKTLGKLRMAVTPYYLSLIDLDDPFDPIRKMAIPALRSWSMPITRMPILCTRIPTPPPPA